MTNSIRVFGFLIVLGLGLASQAAFIVPESQQIMVLQFGQPKAQYTEPGLKWKIPFIQNLKVFDSRILDVDPPAEDLILADQKRLIVDTFARYRITDMLVYHKELGDERRAVDRLNTIINSALRSQMGSATLSDVLSTKRSDIMTKIEESVNAAAKEAGIEIVDIRIGRADLPEQTSQSIFARMRSEREREAKEFRAQGAELAKQVTAKADKEYEIILAEAKKKSEILRGEGDETAIKTYADAYKKDPEFYAFYRSLEAYRESMKGDNTSYVLSPDSEFFRFFDKGIKR